MLSQFSIVWIQQAFKIITLYKRILIKSWPTSMIDYVITIVLHDRLHSEDPLTIDLWLKINYYVLLTSSIRTIHSCLNEHKPSV